MKKYLVLLISVIAIGLIFWSCSSDDNTTKPFNERPTFSIISHANNSIYAEDEYIVEVMFYIDNVEIRSDDGHGTDRISDGGFIVTGRTFSYGSGIFDVWLIKIDYNGKIV
ncbi:MAG: hypothetical protein JXR90_00770 [Spirochaetes bacterium]|nr:hypothetical protein [Spirochaetota bacterium]